MVKLNIEDLNNNEKQKKKAVTLYLSEDTFKYVKEHLKNQSVSALIDSALKEIERFIKEKEESENKKEDDKK